MITKHLFLITILIQTSLTYKPDNINYRSNEHILPTTNDDPIKTVDSLSSNHLEHASHRSIFNATSVQNSNIENTSISSSISYCPSNCTCLSLASFKSKHNDSELNLTQNCLYLNLTTSPGILSNANHFELYQQFHPFQLHQLNELNLQFNNLTEPNHNLVYNGGHNQTIIKLSLSHNRLYRFPNLKSLSNSLKYLSLNHNRIVYLGGNSNRIDSYRNLIALNLNHNRIRILHRSFLNREICGQLKYLDLSSNKLIKLDNHSFLQCRQLEMIKLNSNRLQQVSVNAFENLNNLKELDLSRNNLTNLTINFKPLINLKILNLSQNRLQSIDCSFQALVNLQTLNLNENNLIELNADLVKGLMNLRLLQLSNNQIKRINVNWVDNRNIVNLYLEHNQIEQIDSNTFNGLINLKKLYLDYNQIKQIHMNAFKTNSNLIWLFLNDNYLDKQVATNKSLFSHNRIQYLALENNHLTYIPNQLFVNLSTLITIDLSLNQLKYIEENALTSLQKLDELNFDSTELDCDCRMKWFATYYQEKSIDNIYLEHLQCRTPKSLINKSFIDVDTDMFLCEDDYKHYFIKEPKKQLIIKEGQRFELKCKVVTNSLINEDIVFEWRKNNQTLSLSSERDIIEVMKLNKDKDHSINHKLIYSSYLHFLNASSRDEGDYECWANNSFSSIRSQLSRIEISRPSQSMTNISNENYLKVQIGDEIRIDCRVTNADSIQEISLSKNGQNFNTSIKNRIQFDRARQQFIIKNATLEDRGFFTCIQFGKAIRITVVILYEPETKKSSIQTYNQDLEYIDDDQTILINCSTKSTSKAEVMLFEDKIPIEKANNRYLSESNSEILIVKDSKQQHQSNSDLYQCIFKNKMPDQLSTQKIKFNYLDDNWLLVILVIIVIFLICLIKFILICMIRKLFNQFFGFNRMRSDQVDSTKQSIKILNNGQIEANLLNEQKDDLLKKQHNNNFDSPKYLIRNLSNKNDPDIVTKLISYKKVQNSLENIARFNTNNVKLPVIKKVQFKLDN